MIVRKNPSNDQLGPDNYLLGIPRRTTNAEDDEDTEEDDRDGLKDRISHLEERQKKIILVGP